MSRVYCAPRAIRDIRDERAAGNDIAVVVIDTQASCFAGLDENSN